MSGTGIGPLSGKAKAASDVLLGYKEILYSPVLGDVMDQMGFTKQFLSPEIRAISPAMKVMGRAMPVLIADGPNHASRPFGLMTEALDQLSDGEIYIASGGMAKCAAWGELLTATAIQRGAAGSVIDGFHRDTPKVLAQNWPVFSRGSYGQDALVRTSVVDYRIPIQVGEVQIRPGDLIFGDVDGVVVIPVEVESEVLERALAKATTENLVLRAIQGGMSSSTALASFGVL